MGDVNNINHFGASFAILDCKPITTDANTGPIPSDEMKFHREHTTLPHSVIRRAPLTELISNLIWRLVSTVGGHATRRRPLSLCLPIAAAQFSSPPAREERRQAGQALGFLSESHDALQLQRRTNHQAFIFRTRINGVMRSIPSST